MQTRMESVVEKLIDLFAAICISTWLTIFIIQDTLHIGEVSIGQALYSTLIFSGASFIRGYFIRRMCNSFVVKRVYREREKVNRP